MAALGALVLSAIGTAGTATHAAAAGSNTVYVSPTGMDGNPGTQAMPVQSLQQAQRLVRGMNGAMTSDVTVVLEDGYHRLTSPLTLDASDSGTGGHNVVWAAAAGARPVVAGSNRRPSWPTPAWSRRSAGCSASSRCHRPTEPRRRQSV